MSTSMTMQTGRSIGLDCHVGDDQGKGARLEVWANEIITDGAPFDSRFDDRTDARFGNLRALIAELDTLIKEDSRVTRFTIVENRVIVVTDRQWMELDVRLIKMVASFLNWVSYVMEPHTERRPILGDWWQ